MECEQSSVSESEFISTITEEFPMKIDECSPAVSEPALEEANENNIPSIEIKLFENASLVELSRSSWYPSNCKEGEVERKQTYSRGCKWSPDGTCCLTVINNGGVHVLELPRDLYQRGDVSEVRPVDVLDSVVHVPESGLIYDFCWYPGMSSNVPESCCWITTRQHGPIQMWDGFDGALRCSYRGFNSVDELEAAISLAFSPDGTQIHGGYKKCLKTFCTERPGREYVNQAISGSAASLACSCYQDGLIAVGSWKTDIGLYDIREGKTKSMGKMKAHSGGVTHMQFLPDGTKLVSGARKDSKLLVWDIRYYKSPYKMLNREVKTNQRIYFDVSRCGKYLVSGGTNGIVHVWDLTQELGNENSEYGYKEYMYPLHNDCCNGVSIHPYCPILATSSGQHHIFNDDLISDLDCDDGAKIKDDLMETAPEELLQNDEDDNNTTVDKNVFFKTKLTSNRIVENSLQFWWTGPSSHENNKEQ